MKQVLDEGGIEAAAAAIADSFNYDVLPKGEIPDVRTDMFMETTDRHRLEARLAVWAYLYTVESSKQKGLL